MSINADGRETHLNLDASDRSVWKVATNDLIVIKKIERLGFISVRNVGETKFYELPYSAVLMRKGKRYVSEEQREASKQRLAASRK